MKKILIGLAVVVILIVGALFALPLFIPSETVRAELIARLEDATGRDVRIDGPISISVLPTASLSAGGVGLGGLTGKGEAFSVESVSFGLSLLPLIGGNVEINALTIAGPRIVYEIDENGVSNWDGPPPANAADSIEDLIATEPAAPEATAEVITGLDKLSIGRVTVVDGTFVYRDRQSGTEEVVEGVNLTMDMPKITGPGSVDGTFRYLGTEYKVALEVGERASAERFERIPVGLTLSADGGSATLDGTAFDGDTLFAGAFTGKGDSLRNFLGGFAGLPDAPGYAAFALDGKLVVTPSDVLVESFQGTVGGVPVTGGLRAAYDRVRPGIGMKLALGKVDLAQFSPPASDGGNAGTAGSEPIDFSMLGLFDANIDFTAEEIVSGDMAARNLGMDVKLTDRVLEAGIRSIEINGAPGSGKIAIDARAAEPTISGAVKMSGVDIPAVLALAGQSAPVTGTAGMDITFSTKGATSNALASNLQAGGSVTLTKARVTGLDLADMVGGDASANTLDDIDITTSFASLTSPMKAEGSVTWRGTRFAIAANVDARPLLLGRDVPVTFNAKSDRVSIGFDGAASLDGLGAGRISLSTGSLRDLLAWIGQPLEAGRGLKAFSIAGNVKLTADSFSFDNAAFTLDKSSGVGTGTLAFGGKPTLTAGLNMKILDVSPYLATPKNAASGGGGGGSGGGGSGGGGSGGGGGGDEPIDFSGLKAMDANLNLKAESILANAIKIGPSALTIKIAGGRLDANLSQMALYSGSGTGAIAIDGAAKTPAIGASFRLAGVDALAFLSDAMNFKRIEGTGSFAFDLKASGNTQSALTRSLSGNGSMDVSNGAIRGVNIPKMLQTLSVQSVLGWQPSNDKTAFDKVGATFTIDQGIVTNRDLLVSGKQFQLAGAGTINLPVETISYRLNAKVANKNGKLQDFAAPVLIEGPLAKPKIYPDVQGILQNPSGAINQIEEIGGNLLGLDQGGNKGGGGGSNKAQDDGKSGGKKNNKKKDGNKSADPTSQGVQDLINGVIGGQ
ncbi:MAG: AsmA family protein [Bauldia sp.]|nr:AsmA family protein [Bauldia sp.]